VVKRVRQRFRQTVRQSGGGAAMGSPSKSLGACGVPQPSGVDRLVGTFFMTS
jgi:hypothetical protein